MTCSHPYMGMENFCNFEPSSRFNPLNDFLWGKMYTKSIKEGQDYRILPNVITINITGFDILPDGDVHPCFHLREDTKPAMILPRDC